MSTDTPYSLNGSVAVVTGGGKGIGRGIALCLARAGADVAVAARTEADVNAVAEEIRGLGRRASALAMDVTARDNLERLADTAIAELGAIDIWVNNAGGLPDATPRYLTRTPEERWDAQMNLNLRAVWLGCVTAAARMRDGGGSIVNISSRGAEGPQLKNGPYGAAKAAVNSLTQTFSRELAPKVRVNAVAPGPIPTQNFNESTKFPDDKPLEEVIGVPLGRLGTPEDVGHSVVFLVAPASSWITGQCLYVTGGL